MSAGDPQGLNPWVDARGHHPHPLLLPHPRAVPVEEEVVRFLGPPVRVRRGPRPAVVLVTLLLAAGSSPSPAAGGCRRPAFGPPRRRGGGSRPARRPAAGSAAVRELRLHRHAARRRRTRRVQPVPADPLRRPTGRRARRRCGAHPDGGRPGVRRDRAPVRGRRRHARRRPARTARPTSPTCTGRAGRPCSSPGRRRRSPPSSPDEIAGIAGSASVTRAGRSVYVTGSVTLDSEDVGRARRPAGHPGDRARRRHPRARPPGRARPRRRPHAAHVPEPRA